MISRPSCWMTLALAIAGCGSKPEDTTPARVAEGYYRCVYNGRTPMTALDFVIGPGDSFTTFNTGPGLFQPGTYTYQSGVLSLTKPSEVLQFKAMADKGDHSGPFRWIVKDGKLSQFLCTQVTPYTPTLESLRHAAAAQ